MKDLFHDVVSVLGAHAVALFINLSSVGDWLKILSLVLACGYTIWKWKHDYKKSKRKKHGT